MRTVVIAEAGVNHNGDLELAHALIDVAVDAGADYVKFQTFSADRQVTRTASKADYQLARTDKLESQYVMLKKLELTELMHQKLIEYCHLKKIGFLSTAFDVGSIDLLLRLGQSVFKIPSGELTNLPYLRHLGQTQKKIIMSTGMATLLEIKQALTVLERAGAPRKTITVLHCTTEYPTPMEEVNLLAMQTIATDLGVAVGYSDHTVGIEIAIAAVALGATVIEKHFTLDRNLPGPDHQASIEPAELKAMITAIRNLEQAKGDGIKRPSVSEIKNKSIVRKSLVASRTIKEGEVFTSENITAKRPGTGISPMRWDEIIGKKSNRNYDLDDLINI